MRLPLVILLALLAVGPLFVATALASGPWTLTALPAQGTVTWRCDHGRYGLAFHAFADSATDRVTFRGVSHTVQPGQRLRLPALRALRQRLVVVQSTEPGTLSATVDVDFRPRPASPSHCYSYLPPAVTVHVSPR